MTGLIDYVDIPPPRDIAKALQKIADWYLDNRPERDEITLSRVAWERLRIADKRTLRRYDIERQEDGGMTYGGFTLRCQGRPKGGGRAQASGRHESRAAA